MNGWLERTDIGAVVTDDYLLDFLILYESLAESWTSSPFALHAFVLEDQVARRLAGLGLEHVEIHRLPGEPGDWRENAARRIDLVEHSRLERCIVSDVDNLVLAETPELSLLLADSDLIFVVGPSPVRPIQTALWSFRRTGRSVEFARKWRARPSELAELLKSDDFGGAVKVLAPGSRPSAYGVDADLPALSFQRDWLGFREERAGRVKVVHLRGLRAAGRRSLAERIDVLVDRFPRMAPLMPFYLTLAERAAGRLGLELVPNPMAHARNRLLDAGVLGTRNELPELLNRRGLGGEGVEVGIKRGIFSEVILRSWRGRKLISVDPWREVPPDEYVDVANVAQAEQEHFYEQTVARLEKFGERSEIWRTTSTEAAARIEPHSLDFVYLDARHDYESVKEDLEHWFPRVRPGGILAGHDYVDGLLPEGRFGVKSAVDEFFEARGLAVTETYVDPGTRAGPPRSWLVEIPRTTAS